MRFAIRGPRPASDSLNPLAFSICIPAFHAERYLPATLASLRAQTRADWELIVIEDGTEDRTEEIVTEFGRQGRQPVTFFRHPENRGLPATRNTGIALARSTWIVLLDNDDLWMPDHLASLAACAERCPGAELIHAGSLLFDSESGRELEVRAPSPAVTAAYPRSLFLGTYCIQPSSVMLRKSLWTRVGGFDAHFRYAEDREMWMRCAQAGAAFAYTGENTCRYRKHPESLSTHASHMAMACALIFDRAAQWREIPPRLRRIHAAEGWLSVGRIVLRRDPRAARSHFARARFYRMSPRVLVYSAAALVLCLSRRLRLGPSR